MLKYVLSLGVLMKLFCFGRVITYKDFAESFLGITVTENNSELSNTINGRRGININWTLLSEEKIKEIIGGADITYKTVLEEKKQQVEFLYHVIYDNDSGSLDLVEKFYKLFQHVMLPTNRDKRYQGYSTEILSAIENCNQKELFAAFSKFIGVDNADDDCIRINSEKIINHAANYIEKYQLPRYNLSDLRYDADNTCFCGREDEVQLLISFINDSKPLLWWAITGNGGVGKSRLAYEFTKKLNSHQDPTIQGKWKAIMVEWSGFFSHIKACLNDMVEWNASKHYLIIIDYVQSFEQEIASFIQSLARLSWHSTKVRVLLIERARKTKDKEKNKYEPLWYRTFKLGWNNIDWLNGTCYNLKFIDLKSLDHDSAASIVKSYLCSKNKSISNDECDALVSYVESISIQGVTPLLLLCVAETWIESPSLYNKPEKITASSIWLKIIEKEKREITQNLKGTVSEALLDIHIISCIVHKVEITQDTLNHIFSIKRFNRYQHFKDEIISIIYKSKYIIHEDYSTYLTAIEPDIIGEYYVYNGLKDYSKEEYLDLFSNMFKLSEDETLRFCMRYNSDFFTIASEHPGFGGLNQMAMAELADQIYLIDSVRSKESEDTPYSSIGMEERITFSVRNDQDKEIEYEVLFTFDSDETGKSYMVYTDNSRDENGNVRVFASSYIPGEDTTELFPIESEMEWRIIDTVLKELQKDAARDL